MTRLGYTFTLLIGASLAVAGCSNSVEEPTAPPPPGATTGGMDGNTFDHDNGGISVWDLIDRLSKEGPPSFTSHMHSCAKVRYANLANVLTSVGVNVASTTALSAGALYKAAASAEGTANYATRVRENIAVTTSGASAMFDVFAAAAPEVITALPTLERCKVNGTSVGPLFDATTNACNLDAITCILGFPAQPGHVEQCNKAVTDATTPDVGKRIAVAALLAAAYTCE